jgi:hypothetical protein
VTAIAAPIFVDHIHQLMLRNLWAETEYWMNAANGRRDAFNSPIARMLAKDLARKSLDRYCGMIDRLLPNDGKPNKPKDTA